MELQAEIGGFGFYVLLALAYYGFQAYKAYQKKQSDINKPLPHKQKKRSFLDEILKEAKKQIDTQTQPQPVAQKPKPPTSTKKKPQQPVKASISKSTIKGTLDISYLDNLDSIEYSDTHPNYHQEEVFQDVPRKAPATLNIGGKQLNAKELVVAQIIMEQKF